MAKLTIEIKTASFQDDPGLVMAQIFDAYAIRIADAANDPPSRGFLYHNQQVVGSFSTEEE